MPQPAPTACAFTLVELLLAVSVVAVLCGLTVAAALQVRASARLRSADATLELLHAACIAYSQQDPRHRLPDVDPLDSSLSTRPIAPATTGVLDLLESAGLFAAPAGSRDAAGRYLDPWGGPWRYVTVRPAVAAGLNDWNWDPGLGHERRWGRVRDPATGATVDGPLPFPYLHSLGPAGDPTATAGWIYRHDPR